MATWPREAILNFSLMPSICFVAGDPSGDVHAAHLIEALKTRSTSWIFSGLGGPAMQRAGMALLNDLTQASSIGPFDAARHLGQLLSAKRLLAEHLSSHRPDLVILVDFGDFNLPVIAPLVKKHRIPILYYISPQIWAWGRWRLRYIRRYINRMVVFFPFEETLYQREHIPVTWVGHPLVGAWVPSLNPEETIRQMGLNPWRRIVGLLPGSRLREFERHLPLMLAAARKIAKHMPGVQFLLPKASTIPDEILRSRLSREKLDIHIVEDSSPNALQIMEAAIIASGTATLEAALCGTPMVVVYRASWPTYVAARLVVRIPRIAMVNVIADREVVPELVQHRASAGRIASAIVSLLRDEERLKKMRDALYEVKERLGPPGAVERAASAVIELLNGK